MAFDFLYSSSLRSISFFGTARTCRSKSSNCLNSFGFFISSAFRAVGTRALNSGVFRAWCFLFPGELLVRHALPGNSGEGQHEATLIVSEPLVEAKRFFIKIAEHVKRFHGNVRAFNHSLQETPEVFDPVRVDRAVNVSFSMTDEGVLKAFGAERVIRAVLIGVNLRSFFHGLANDAAHFVAPRFRNDTSLNLGLAFFLAALKQAKHRSLSRATRAPMETLLAFLPVHVSGERSDVGFIDFDLTAEGFNRVALHGKSDPVHHVPSGLLRYAEGAADFMGTNAVLRASDQPETGKPLVERKRGILKDRPLLNAEMLVALPAAPRAALWLIHRVLGFAFRAFGLSIRPTKLREELDAKVLIRKELDRFLKCLGKCFVRHDGGILADASI